MSEKSVERDIAAIGRAAEIFNSTRRLAAVVLDRVANPAPRKSKMATRLDELKNAGSFKKLMSKVVPRQIVASQAEASLAAQRAASDSWTLDD